MRIRLIGGIEVLRAGRALALPASKKTRALLAYLLLEPRPAPRSRLCELLWEGPDDPRASLRWSLTKIRDLVDQPGARRLITEGDAVSIAPTGLQLDVAEVRAVFGPGERLDDTPTDRLVAAAGLCRGELLEGLELVDCYRFHEWCAAQREELRRLRAGVLQTLVARLHAAPEEALRHARAWVELDPLVEEAHAAVVETLGRLGRGREALEQYDQCRRILEGEAGLSIGGSLERARRALSARAPTASTPPTEAPALPAPAAAPALVGRRAELDAFAARLAAAAAGQPGPALLVTGDPGLGKSRLLEAFAATVASAGGRVLSGRGYEAEGLRPYGPWTDALAALPAGAVPEAARGDLTALLPGLPAAASAGGDRGRLFEAVLAVLRACAAARPPLLVAMDDVQWIDEASAALLHFAARLGGAGVVVALAARPGEIQDNPAALRLLRGLRREGLLTELPLAPLPPAHIAQLLAGLGTGLDGDHIAAEAEGNPLYALELARAALGRDAGGALPATLGGLLSDRLDRLDEGGRAVVAWAAALGRRFRVDVLARVAALQPGDLMEAIETLERQGVLRPAGGGDYDFSHDLLRRAAYGRLSAPRRRVCHARIAECLGTLDDPAGALQTDVAHHAAQAGDDQLAARAYAAGAARSLRLYAYAAAAELADRGRHHLQRVRPELRLPIEIELLRILTRAHGAQRFDELAQDLRRLIDEAEARRDPGAAVAGFMALAHLDHQTGDHHAAFASLARAEQALRAGDPATSVGELAHIGRCLVMVGREMPRARALVLEAEALGRRHGIEHRELFFGLGMLHEHDGEHAAAVPLLERAQALFAAEGDHFRDCECLGRLAMIALAHDRLAEAARHIATLGAVAARIGAGGSEGPFAEAMAALLALAEDRPGALARVDEAAAVLRKIDSQGALSFTLATSGELELARNHVPSARRRAEAALAAAQRLAAASDIGVAGALLARALAAAGERDAAAAQLRATWAECGARETLTARAWAALAAASREVGAEPPAEAVPLAPRREAR
jgi:DNA-binding SARP family transcriptional activator